MRTSLTSFLFSGFTGYPRLLVRPGHSVDNINERGKFNLHVEISKVAKNALRLVRNAQVRRNDRDVFPPAERCSLLNLGSFVTRS